MDPMCFWHTHLQSCGGVFDKTRSPEEKVKCKAVGARAVKRENQNQQGMIGLEPLSRTKIITAVSSTGEPSPPTLMSDTRPITAFFNVVPKKCSETISGATMDINHCQQSLTDTIVGLTDGRQIGASCYTAGCYQTVRDLTLEEVICISDSD